MGYKARQQVPPRILLIGTITLFPNLHGGAVTGVITVQGRPDLPGKIRVELILLDGDGKQHLVERRISSQQKSENPAARVVLSEYNPLFYGSYEVVAESLATGETAAVRFELYPWTQFDELRMSSTLLSAGCSREPLERVLAAATDPGSSPPREDLFSPLNEGTCKWIPLNPKLLNYTDTLYARLTVIWAHDEGGRPGQTPFPGGRSAGCTIRTAEGKVVARKSAKIATGRYNRGWDIVQGFDPRKDRLSPGDYNLEFTLSGPDGKTLRSGDTFEVEAPTP